MSAADTSVEKDTNTLRAMSYIFSILLYLQDEPVCRRCKSFSDTIELTKEKFLALERSVNQNRVIPDEIRRLLSHIYRVLAALTVPENPVKQKRTGDCTMPSGICLAKSALRLYENTKELTQSKEAVIR